MSNPNLASRFDEIYNSTSKSVLTLITSRCGCAADINDIFQETYIELYGVMCKRGADYIINERAFVLQIAKRKVAKHYALLEKLRIFVPMQTVNDNGDEFDLADFSADEFLSEDFTATDNLMDDIREAIQSKPEDVQKVFYLTFDMGLSISEVGQALRMSESGVKNKLYRTLKELRVLFR